MAEFPKHPFLLSVQETAQALQTDVDKGLTTLQVSQLQEKYPKNELDVGGTIPWYKILTKQLLNAMIIVSFTISLNLLKKPILLTIYHRCSRLPWRSASVLRIISKVVCWHSSSPLM
jgi:hypothetical protein